MVGEPGAVLVCGGITLGVLRAGNCLVTNVGMGGGTLLVPPMIYPTTAQ